MFYSVVANRRQPNLLYHTKGGGEGAVGSTVVALIGKRREGEGEGGRKAFYTPVPRKKAVQGRCRDGVTSLPAKKGKTSGLSFILTYPPED